MTEVYVVTSGEYSSYQIEAVFDNMETAEMIARLFYDGRVETYELNPSMPGEDKIRNGLFPFRVWMSKDGSGDAFRMDADDFESQIHIYLGRLNIHVWAKDREHALKIANEKRGMILANGKWKDGFYDGEGLTKVR